MYIWVQDTATLVNDLIYLERSQTLDKDPFVAVLEVKGSWEMIHVTLKCKDKKGKEDYFWEGNTWSLLQYVSFT